MDRKELLKTTNTLREIISDNESAISDIEYNMERVFGENPESKADIRKLKRFNDALRNVLAECEK
jgi:regulator of replication initiation timing